MHPIWDDLVPLDEVFLESMIRYELLIDVESVMVKSNPKLLIKLDPSDDQSLSSDTVEFLDFPIEL